MPGVSAEATFSRNYIEWLVSVPWKKSSKEIKDIELAEQILNEDHFGLEKIKKRNISRKNMKLGLVAVESKTLN